MSVWDGGDEAAIKETTDESAIIDSLESVHLSELVIHRREPLDYRINERVKVIPFQVDRDETVVDFSTFNDGLGIVESWWEAGAI
jgi:hypothetical protein